MIDLSIALVGLLLLAVGLWWIEPALSLSVTGGVLFLTSVIAQFVKQRNTPDA